MRVFSNDQALRQNGRMAVSWYSCRHAADSSVMALRKPRPPPTWKESAGDRGTFALEEKGFWDTTAQGVLVGCQNDCVVATPDGLGVVLPLFNTSAVVPRTVSNVYLANGEDRRIYSIADLGRQPEEGRHVCILQPSVQFEREVSKRGSEAAEPGVGAWAITYYMQKSPVEGHSVCGRRHAAVAVARCACCDPERVCRCGRQVAEMG